ncbi:hypothetical protein niasHT_038703 [Heterodera trifolii]|uniref:F-box domain-containing protein n=1 Tax=Heterodera trifolii TaxID=157864 RepID=A0ABD2I7C3_9BILA
MSDTRKEAEQKMAKAIFISGDCWLAVFDLLPPSQLAFGIAMISHRFDFYVAEHFKTRKWALKFLQIQSQIGENGTKEVKIVNYGKPAPIPRTIPRIEFPRKVSGFERIIISYIDRNAIEFLHRLRQLFVSSPMNLTIETNNDRILESISRNIWPMIGKNIGGMHLSGRIFHRLRQFVPSILRDCPSLRVVSLYYVDMFTEFPADDNAMASDGQAIAKWLFTPRSDGVPKVFKSKSAENDRNSALMLEAFKTAFINASSPVNFVVDISFPYALSVVPFELTNGFTREQLALKRTDYHRRFLLVRCPIVRDVDKWAKWEKEAIGWEFPNQWKRIYILIFDEDEIGDGLLNATPGPSDQQ